jgi:hypothetical protein
MGKKNKNKIKKIASMLWLFLNYERLSSHHSMVYIS